MITELQARIINHKYKRFDHAASRVKTNVCQQVCSFYVFHRWTVVMDPHQSFLLLKEKIFNTE